MILSSCSSVNQNKSTADWIAAYKNTAFISCISENVSSENEISSAVNRDIIGNSMLSKQADSLGKAFYQKIKPSVILDFNNGKVAINGCLEYYNSEELDRAAKEAYRNYKKSLMRNEIK